ncbi:MAG: hypothetical protein PSX80_00745 [bacterium]|nr:hypothetical protein [bacterium]
MAKEFDNSLERFARPATGTAYYLAAATAVVLVVSVLVGTVVSQSWLLAGIAALATAAVLGWMAVGARRHRKTIADKAAGWIAWEPIQPDLQRQTLNVAVGEISRSLKGEPEAFGDAQTAFIVGEDLALRQIQRQENVPVMRHISVGGVPFDAAFTKEDILVCCEVCFLVAPELGQDRVAAMMRKIATVKRSIAEMNIGLEVRLMVVIVTQMPSAKVEKLRETLSTKRFSSTPVDIDIRVMDFEELQRIYVTE